VERGAEFALKKACKSFPETTLRTKFLCTEDLGAASFAQTDENEDFLHIVGYTPPPPSSLRTGNTADISTGETAGRTTGCQAGKTAAASSALEQQMLIPRLVTERSSRMRAPWPRLFARE